MIIHATMMSRLFRGGRAWALGGDELTHKKSNYLLLSLYVCEAVFKLASDPIVPS